ncbi:MAG: NapC/NirT family cytochrome c [Desulfovibrionaceae bacterium]|nr:NapC/NirT family cytochrome c [Desulfovibrionaceae bacterium]
MPIPIPKKRTLLVGSLIVLGCVGAVAAGVHVTSGNGFCLSCHEMRVYHDELQASSHAKDADGKEISCSQCHIPSGNIVRMLTAKAWMGAIDIWVHTVDGGEDLDRAAMQKVARRFTDDANCLACHEDLGQNAKKNGPVSAEGRLAHDNYLGRNGQARSGCVGCHQNLAHLPVFDERIPRNQEFARKLKESRS